MSESTTTWPKLAEGLYTMLTGRGAEISYQLDNLQVQVLFAARADAQQAPWTLNGTLRDASEDHHAKQLC